MTNCLDRLPQHSIQELSHLFTTHFKFTIRLVECKETYAHSHRNHSEVGTPIMKEKIFSGIFSLSGVSLMLAVAGFVSALVTMFVDVADRVSVKLLIFVILLSVSLLVILLKIVFDLTNEKRPAAPFEHPIMFLPDEKIFVIRRNENFVNSIIVGCYSHQDAVDRLAYIAFVHHVQDEVIQIKIQRDLGILRAIPSSTNELRSLIIRPVVPVTALEQYTKENASE